MAIKIASVIGERIGAYVIVRQIGEGGMGSVWLAEHAMLGRRAAIKMLHATLSSNAEVTTRFFNEARAATAIQDAGIVQIFDFGQHVDGRAYIVMELLDGESLDRRLGRLGRLPVPDTLRIMRQIASSLGAAHACGIVHRDLKPDNIFLVRDSEVPGGERAKILDFGIAKIADASGMKTDTALVMGTPMFMSPEQCRGAGKVDQRSDVYSLGCMMFTLLTGRTPFHGEGPGDIIAMHLRELPPVPSTLAPGIPHSVDSLVLRCLEKDPTRRYASGREVAEAIAAIPQEPRATSQSDAQNDAGTSGIRSVPAHAHSTTLTSYTEMASQRSLDGRRTHGDRRLALMAAAGLLLSGTAAFLLLRSDEGGESPTQIASSIEKPPTPTAPEKPPTPTPVTASLAPQSSATLPTPSPTQPPAPVQHSSLPTAPPAPIAVAQNVRSSSTNSVRPSLSKATLKAAKAQPGGGTASLVASSPTEPPAAPSVTPAPTAEAPPAPRAPVEAPTPTPTPPPPPESSAAEKPEIPCYAQIANLDAFIAAHYNMSEQSQVRTALTLGTDCFDRKDRLRLAIIVIDAACKLDLKRVVHQFHDIAPSESLRARCPKFFPEAEPEEVGAGD